MEDATVEDFRKPETDSYYLPMHGVVKEASTTTKLRVVFDASAKTSSGVSVNDKLLPGPPQLTFLILAFRQHHIGMTSDISKMFREVGLHHTERDYHRYLVRGEKNGQSQDWKLSRLTFEVTSSPFLASSAASGCFRPF